MNETKKKNPVLKFFGVIMLLFAIVYGIVGTMALMGRLNGVLPGHEAQEMLVIVLAYAIAVFGLICGIACLAGAAGACRVLGLILGIAGLAGLIYLQVTQDAFNLFDCIAMVLGFAIFGAARNK